VSLLSSGFLFDGSVALMVQLHHDQAGACCSTEFLVFFMTDSTGCANHLDRKGFSTGLFNKIRMFFLS